MTIMPKARAAIEAGSPVKIFDRPILFAYASITLDRLSGRDPGEINQIIEDMHATGKLKELSLYYQGADFTQEAALYTISTLTQLP